MAQGKSTPSNQQTLNLSVRSGTRELLRAFCDATGRSQQFVAARLVEWFVSQPATVKRVVLGEIQDMEAEHAAALEQIAAQIRASSKPKGRG